MHRVQQGSLSPDEAAKVIRDKIEAATAPFTPPPEAERPRPMSEAPRDGTRILAWWPPLTEDEGNDGWLTTWWGHQVNRVEEGWENACEWERPDSDYAPTMWLPHPNAPLPEVQP
jgi:hypothetical protein